MSTSPREILASGAAELGISLSEAQLDQFDRFTELLLEWNSKFNLTRITDPAEIAVKHYLDSLSVLSVVKFQGEASLIDVGTGAGLPAIPLKIAIPGLRVDLLDSVRKRLTFLDAVAQDMGMTDVTTVHSRAEDAGRDKALRERFDFSVSRAVARLNLLSEFCIPFCKVGGMFIAYKGPDADEEISDAVKAIRTLGGKIEAVHKFTLPGDLGRTIIAIKKTKPTPLQYPRKAGVPERNPIK